MEQKSSSSKAAVYVRNGFSVGVWSMEDGGKTKIICQRISAVWANWMGKWLSKASFDTA